MTTINDLYYEGGFDPEHPSGNVKRRLIDNEDGTGTRILYAPDGTVTSTEELTDLPVPEPEPEDPYAVYFAALAEAATLEDQRVAAAALAAALAEGA